MTKSDSTKTNTAELSSPTGKKKPYKKPEIKEHGKVEELTKMGGSNRANDFFGRRF